MSTKAHIGAHHTKDLTPDVAIISHVAGMGGSKSFLLLMRMKNIILDRILINFEYVRSQVLKG